MKIIYITLENAKEAREIGREILKQKLSNCVNFFPITCIYNYKGKITEEPEVVLIVKTKAGYYEKIRNLIKKYVKYDNFIGQFAVEKIDDDFSAWLNNTVK